MNPTYTLKNFRVFDEQGATFEIAPITILTGCNSSGKSSITKSLMLLQPLMSKYKKEIQSGEFGGFSGTGFSSHNLDFTKGGNHKLGNFEKVVNWDSKNKQFSVSYSTYSYALHKVMDVTLTFGQPKKTKDEQTLHAELQRVIISHEGKEFYSYRVNPELKNKYIEETAHVKLSEWKKELVQGLQWLELGCTFERIIEDANEDDAGFGYATTFHSGDFDSVKSYFDEDDIKYLRWFYYALRNRVPVHIKKICKHFDFTNIVRSGNTIDWETTKHEYEFPYLHLYPLGKLMDKLDTISKEDIRKFADDTFILADNVKGLWFNTIEYQSWIRYIFELYVNSQFTKFSEFYSYYENAATKSEYVYFGTKGGHIRPLSEGPTSEFMGAGTACEIETGFNPFKQSGWDSWNGLSEAKIFYRLFHCLQRFGGYENIQFCGGPSITFPQMTILLEYATLACAEIISSCDLMTEIDFIEIDRSNAQRLYSFSAQGTTFNEILDKYYNLPETIYDAYDQSHLNGKTYRKSTFAAKWLKELTGYSGFSLNLAPEGVGYYIYIEQTLPNGDIRKISLTDLGYGVTPLISMLLRMEIMICTYLDRAEKVTICIEEPESNLHPSLQSRLAEIFADAVEHYPINLVLETHSEYLIRKLQFLVSDKKISPEKIIIHYLYSPINEQLIKGEIRQPQTKRITIELDGLLSDNFGIGFFDEASNTQLDIIRKIRGIK